MQSEEMGAPESFFSLDLRSDNGDSKAIATDLAPYRYCDGLSRQILCGMAFSCLPVPMVAAWIRREAPEFGSFSSPESAQS
jgi:hypothetical protein